MWESSSISTPRLRTTMASPSPRRSRRMCPARRFGRMRKPSSNPSPCGRHRPAERRHGRRPGGGFSAEAALTAVRLWAVAGGWDGTKEPLIACGQQTVTIPGSGVVDIYYTDRGGAGKPFPTAGIAGGAGCNQGPLKVYGVTKDYIRIAGPPGANAIFWIALGVQNN